MSLIELQDKIHQQNKDMGWWDKPRPFSTFVCLFHSELSEAMEGDRKGLPDDHLPQYPMFQVELADFVIRCLDWLGSRNANEYNQTEGAKLDIDNCTMIAFLHKAVSNCMDNNGNPEDAEFVLSSVVEYCFQYAEYNEFDLYKIILEKVEYNKHRADHKRENRAKEGGKKY
jgi:hypothetical protein